MLVLHLAFIKQQCTTYFYQDSRLNDIQLLHDDIVTKWILHLPVTGSDAMSFIYL